MVYKMLKYSIYIPIHIMDFDLMIFSKKCINVQLAYEIMYEIPLRSYILIEFWLEMQFNIQYMFGYMVLINANFYC